MAKAARKIKKSFIAEQIAQIPESDTRWATDEDEIFNQAQRMDISELRGNLRIHTTYGMLLLREIRRREDGGRRRRQFSRVYQASP
jgi:hypothetical protein